MVPGGYVIAGTSTVDKNINTNQLSLTLTSNFNTQSGPDLYVYLAKNLDSPAAVGNESYEVAKLLSPNGAQTYTFNNIPLQKYNYVLIHCKQFNHLWGGALLGTTTGTCNTVSNENPENIETEFSVYPNPVSGKSLMLSGNILQKEAVLYDISGKERMKFLVNTALQSIELPNLESGIYWLKLGDKVKSVVVE